MDSKKVALVAVSVVVLLVAGVVVWKQFSAPAPPASVLQGQVERIQASEPFEVRKFTAAEWADASIDPETSYREIDGKLWAEKVECISCKQPIPAAPIKKDSDGPLGLAKFKCPRCGKPAYMTD